MSFISTHSYSLRRKKIEFLYNNLGIHTLVLYFCSMLIDLIIDYKNIYSHNNYVCLEKGVGWGGGWVGLYDGFLQKLILLKNYC